MSLSARKPARIKLFRRPEEELRGAAERHATLLREAARFAELFHAECPDSTPVDLRLREIHDEIARSGSYTHTRQELAFGARVAWRNSSRCIGRLYWRSLRIRDRREVTGAAEVAAESFRHLAEATARGRIRPTITVFAPDRPGRPGPRIWNDQLIRYAGYRQPGGGVLGDPMSAAFTQAARDLGWPGGPGTPFDLLPLVVQAGGGPARFFPVPSDVVLEVPLSHPDFSWFAGLGLRWHAVPAISSMSLEVGGIRYPAAPFNGWYMGTEIGARNLGDVARYDLLPVVAARLGLDTGRETSLWRDRALVELNVAVLHSFRTAGVTIADHHTESRRFLTHVAREEHAGRVCPADWAWIVPPISGSATPVFHRSYHDADLRPGYVQNERPYGCKD
ncbi:MAG: Nitric-oxide synthase [Streptosporangiaceae bacterium]|jgi:nitric-oxide synthase|nr:Nitric-oxide synthase [Streptosporangiaceae bacterium]